MSILDAAFATRDLADWMARMHAAGVTFGVVSTLDEIVR